MPPKKITATKYADKKTNIAIEARKDKAEKGKTARNLWVPAINNHGGYGRWAFLEITDPWDAMGTIRNALTVLPVN